MLKHQYKGSAFSRTRIKDRLQLTKHPWLLPATPPPSPFLHLMKAFGGLPWLTWPGAKFVDVQLFLCHKVSKFLQCLVSWKYRWSVTWKDTFSVFLNEPGECKLPQHGFEEVAAALSLMKATCFSNGWILTSSIFQTLKMALRRLAHWQFVPRQLVPFGNAPQGGPGGFPPG